MIIAVICGSFSTTKAFADKMPRIQRQFQDMANKMNNHGALAVVGMGISNRMDIGKNKAIEDAKKQIAEQRKNYVEVSVSDFRNEISVGKGAEHNDVFKEVIESMSATIISGALVNKFSYFETKNDKKEGTSTYIVLYVITPEAMQRTLEAELKTKGSKANLYQLYMESKAKEEHDEMIKKFKEMEEKE